MRCTGTAILLSLSFNPSLGLCTSHSLDASVVSWSLLVIQIVASHVSFSERTRLVTRSKVDTQFFSITSSYFTSLNSTFNYRNFSYLFVSLSSPNYNASL